MEGKCAAIDRSTEPATSGRDFEVHTRDADGLDWVEYDARYGGFDMEAEPEAIVGFESAADRQRFDAVGPV